MRFLCLFDFSPAAKNAGLYAMSIFRGVVDEWLFVHFSLYEPDEEAENGLKEWVRMLSNLPENKAISCKGTSVVGNAFRDLPGLVQARKIKLVVLGIGDRENKSGELNQLLISMPCPILIVSEKTTLQAPKKVVFIVDFKHEAPNETLFPLLEITREHKAELLLLQVVDNADSIDEEVTGLLLNHNLDHVLHSYHSVRRKDIPNGIEKFCVEHQAELLALITNKQHTLLEQIANDIYSKKRNRFKEVPLLILKSKN